MALKAFELYGDIVLHGADKVKNDVKSASLEASKAGENFNGMGLAIGSAVLAGGIAVAKFAADSFEAFGTVEDATVRLRTAVDNSGQSFNSWVQATQDAADKGEKLGYTSAEVEQGLGTLVTMTGSTTKAYKDLGLVEDLARYKGMSLTAAAILVSKAEDGKASSLQRVLPFLTKNMSAEEALAAMHEHLGGQAEAASKTSAGAVRTMNAEWEGFKENFGGDIAPAVTGGLHTISRDMQWFSDWMNSDNSFDAFKASWSDFLGITDNASAKFVHSSGAIAKANAETSKLAGSQADAADSANNMADGTTVAATAADKLAAAQDKLDTATVSYVRDLKGKITTSDTVGAANRDLRDKQDALTQAMKSAEDAHKAVTDAEKKHAKGSIEVKAALAAEDQANLKVKDSQEDVNAAIKLLKQRTDDAQPGLDKYAGGLKAVYGNAAAAAQALSGIKLPSWAANSSANVMKNSGYAAGHITTGAEHALIGEDGGESVIPFENPKYRKQAVALWHFTGGQLGLLPKGTGDIGEGDVADSVSMLRTAMALGMKPMGLASANLKSGAAAFGPVGAMKAYGNSKVGDPYVWGASGPNAFDCSGLASAILAAGGLNYGRFTTATEPGLFDSGRGKYVTLGLIPGHHTGIQVAGQWFEAPHTGANVRTEGRPSGGNVREDWPVYLHPHGFDKGGVFTRPTVGIIGEKRPEFVGALDDLKKMGFGGGDIYVPVTLEVDGEVLAQATAHVSRGQINDFFAGAVN